MIRGMSLKQLTTSQAAKVIGVSGRRVVQLADSGKLVCERTPLGRLYDAADVERVARERTAVAGGGRA